MMKLRFYCCRFTKGNLLMGMAFMALLFVFIGCTESTPILDSGGIKGEPFNPAEAIMVDGFTPDSGGVQQQLVITGTNLGNDTSKMQVFIGGKKAVLISANGTSIYCLVPQGAYNGIIEVKNINETDTVVGVCDDVFTYQRKMIVTTLAGYQNEYNNQGWNSGSFKTCSGFGPNNSGGAELHWDPADSTKLFCAYDQANNNIWMLNFKDSTYNMTGINTGMLHSSRIRSMDFTLDRKYMIIANDNGAPSAEILSRATDNANQDVSGFNLNPVTLVQANDCNGAYIHPDPSNPLGINGPGELYFNSYDQGSFYRFDMNIFYNSLNGVSYNPSNSYTQLFTIQDSGWEFKIYMSPTGDYAYIIVVNQNYILRTDYNWANHTFNQPYVVAGAPMLSGYTDGAGQSARLNRPYQGVFVKNHDYEIDGRSDVYDFYFTDCNNHCIRVLSPQGQVTTFAGRGINGDSNPYGYADGDLRQNARFNQPTGIAYNENENAFYINDDANCRMRKISLEE